MTAGRAVLLIIVVGTVVRIGFAAFTGLGYDESYMVGNARILALGYVDHPPLHVWIAGLAARLFSSEAPLLVRLPFIALFAGSTWLMYRLTARLFGTAAGLWATIAFSLAPVFSLNDGTFVLPDGPAIFFLLATAIVVARILFDQRPLPSPTLRWLAAGLLIGLAMLSKFNAAFFPAAVFVYLLTVRDARRHLATLGPWLAAVVALIVLLPAIIWNLEHGLIGVSFQAGRIAASGLRLDYLAQQVGGELLYLTPWLAVPFAISLGRALLTGPREPKAWLMALAAIGPIVAFTVVTLWSHGLPHWTMPGWLFAIPIFGRDAAELAARRPAFARRYMAAVAVVFAVLFSAFMVQTTRGGIVPEAIVAAHPGLDPTVDLVDWTDLKAALAERGLIGPDTVVAAPSWTIAGKASYALGAQVPVLCLCANPQQFAYRYDQTQFAGRDVIVIVPRGQGWMWDAVGRYFDALEPLDPVEIRRNGDTVMTLDLRLGKNLHFPPK